MTSKNQDDLGRQWQCSPLIPALGKQRQNSLCCLSSSFEKALNMQNIYRESFQNSMSLISLKLHESKEHCKKDGWKANSITKKFISDMKTVSMGFPAQLVDSLAALILSMSCYPCREFVWRLYCYNLPDICNFCLLLGTFKFSLIPET